MGTQSAQRSQAMYREEEKLCLKWNDFQENAISAFGTLREDREFADVTLACEDGQQVEAHKVILASSSPFFLNLLRRNKHPHPLIYMRGLKSEDLITLIDFLYYGEANVYQENLDSFLAVTEELQLKGLINNKPTEEETSAPIIPKTKRRLLPKVEIKTLYKQDEANEPTFKPTNSVGWSNTESDQSSEDPKEGTVAVTDFTVAADLQDLDEQIKSVMEVSENILGGVYGNRKAIICKACGKEGVYSNIKKHIESIHLGGLTHTCNICGKTSRSRSGLYHHKAREHNQ